MKNDKSYKVIAIGKIPLRFEMGLSYILENVSHVSSLREIWYSWEH